MNPASRMTLALATALLVSPTLARAQQVESYRLSGDRIEIYNLVGRVDVEAGSGSEVTVEVARGGADRAELSVETGPLGGAETLRVIFPDDRIVYPEMSRRSRTEMRVRPDGTFGGRSRSSDRVTITGSGRGMEAFADLTIRVPRGQRIGVFLGVGEVDVRNVEGDLVVDVAAARVTSAGTRGNLMIDTGSGSVDVMGAQGDVSVDTGSGSVEVADITGQRLMVDTGSGSVIGGNINVADLNVDTGSGRIELRTVTSPRVELETGSGSVRVDLTQDVELLDIDTGSGSVTVTIPENTGAEVNVESSSGGIDFDMPVTVRRFSRQAVRGILGDGEGLIRVDTGSGSIRFLRR